MLQKSSFALIIMLLFIGNIFSSDLKKVLPITNKILVVEFDEGHIDYFGIYQTRNNGNKVWQSLLNISQATNVANYQIDSEDDSNYEIVQSPINIGRKAKGEEFHNLYDSSEPAVLKTHWIYIELPYPLQSGYSYTLHLNNIAINTNKFKFKYDENELRSPSVHVNQIGFVPDAPKYAYISQFMGDLNSEEHPNGALNLSELSETKFHIVSMDDNSIQFTGNISLQQPRSTSDFNKTEEDFTAPNMTRADVWQCDFSEFEIPGKFKIVVDGIGCSYPFEISNDIYREPYNLTTRAMFLQRAGIIQEIEPGIQYPRDYRTEDGTIMKYFPHLEGEESFDTSDAAGNVTGIWGWYHDAGDWDTYWTHYRIPMTLLALYDMKPDNFGDGDVNQKYKLNDTDSWINEGENGTPDILDEASWLIRYFKRAKDSLISQGYTDGGVPSYAGVDAGATDGIPSWKDERVIALKGGNNIDMSFRYAACAAYLAICLDKSISDETHPESAKWIEEAEEQYLWAVSNTITETNQLKDAKMEAAAALFRATGNLDYQTELNNLISASTTWGAGLWFNIQPWHYVSTIMGLIPDDFQGLDMSIKSKCINDIKNKADAETVNTANSRGFRLGVDKDIIFMLGTFSFPHTFISALAYEFSGEQKYLDVCYTSADYCLGGNQMNLVRVTQLGDEYEHAVFHPDSWYLFDYNSMVYTNPILPGFGGYDMHRNGDWFPGSMGNIGNGWNWIGDEDYSRSTAYPHIDNFPDGEARFQNRNNIPASEFTVHQNHIQAIFGYGYLCGDYSGKYISNERPTVLLNLGEGSSTPKDSTIILRASTSGDTRIVEYYYDWHYIGESKNSENNFALEWNIADFRIIPGNRLITAKAIDDKGLISNPSDEADVMLKIENVTAVEEDVVPVGKFELHNNYPNPFNPSTTIRYELAENSNVELHIYDVLGNHIKTLVDENQSAGNYTISWDGRNNLDVQVSSGIYFYQIKAGDYSDNKKMALLR